MLDTHLSKFSEYSANDLVGPMVSLWYLSSAMYLASLSDTLFIFKLWSDLEAHNIVFLTTEFIVLLILKPNDSVMHHLVSEVTENKNLSLHHLSNH